MLLQIAHSVCNRNIWDSNWIQLRYNQILIPSIIFFLKFKKPLNTPWICPTYFMNSSMDMKGFSFLSFLDECWHFNCELLVLKFFICMLLRGVCIVVNWFDDSKIMEFTNVHVTIWSAIDVLMVALYVLRIFLWKCKSYIAVYLLSYYGCITSCFLNICYNGVDISCCIHISYPYPLNFAPTSFLSWPSCIFFQSNNFSKQ